MSLKLHKIPFSLATGFIAAAVLVGCAKNSPSSPGSSTSPDSTCSLASAAAQINEPQILSDEGILSEDQDLPLNITLTLNNQRDLEQQLHDLYDPTSPSFHKFFAPGEFRARYAPSTDQVASVTSFLSAHGFHDFSLDDNGYVLRVHGNSRALSSAFTTEVHQYRGENGARYYASTAKAVVPVSLPVEAVIGLQNVKRARPHLRHPSGLAVSSVDGSLSPNILNGTGPNGGLSPSDITTAYNVPTTVNGTSAGHGQTLALVEFDGYQASDITAYENQFGLTHVPLTNILIDSVSGVSSCAQDTAGEVTLDIELMTAIAPGVSGIRVYEGVGSTTGTIDVLTQIANDDLANQVSTSWGFPEDELIAHDPGLFTAENTLFKQMATQGQTFYAATGDTGADGDPTNNPGVAVVQDPSTQPFVVAVGGTRLNLGGGSTFLSETTWNDSATSAGGGGTSAFWQWSGIVTPTNYQSSLAGANGASTTFRNVPDVALNADNNNSPYAIFFNGTWANVGGTSCAAPLWAGFTALVNQQRAANACGSTLGFPNAAIYAIGGGTGPSSYASNFHDITVGTNRGFSAGAGYDLPTGWGSFKGTALFNTLSICSE